MFYVLALMAIDDRTRNIWGTRIVQTALLGALTDYNNIGIAVDTYRDAGDILMNARTSTMTTVLLASGYTNAAGIETCQPTQSFGGGACDPDSTTMELFNIQNEFRMNPTAVDRLKGIAYENEFVSAPSYTVSKAATYKLQPVMQRLSDLSDAQYWGTTYKVYAWDINADKDWHGSKSTDAVKLPADSEYFIYPHDRTHFASLQTSILMFFGDSKYGLD